MKDSDRRMANNRLLALVARIRWRWRTRIFLRGLTWVGVLSCAVLFLSAIGLEQMRFAADGRTLIFSDGKRMELRGGDQRTATAEAAG